MTPKQALILKLVQLSMEMEETAQEIRAIYGPDNESAKQLRGARKMVLEWASSVRDETAAPKSRARRKPGHV